MSAPEPDWEAKADAEVLAAATSLTDYTEEGEREIRDELKRRGLPEPQAPIGACPACHRSVGPNHQGRECAQCGAELPPELLALREQSAAPEVTVGSESWLATRATRVFKFYGITLTPATPAGHFLRLTILVSIGVVFCMGTVSGSIHRVIVWTFFAAPAAAMCAIAAALIANGVSVSRGIPRTGARDLQILCSAFIWVDIVDACLLTVFGRSGGSVFALLGLLALPAALVFRFVVWVPFFLEQTWSRIARRTRGGPPSRPSGLRSGGEQSVGQCPRCGQPVNKDWPNPWCPKCSNRLPWFITEELSGIVTTMADAPAERRDASLPPGKSTGC